MTGAGHSPGDDQTGHHLSTQGSQGMRDMNAPRWIHRRRIMGGIALMLVVCVAIVGGSTLLLASLNTPHTAIRATATAANTATSVPTVQYQAPKVVQATPTKPPPPPPTAYKPPPGPAPAGGVPNIYGQLILVSLSQQWLWAYNNRTLLYDTPITSGMPQLPTPDGVFHIQYKEYDVTFYSPWPPGSPYYYSPEHINYAMYFADYGYFVHDAPWRHMFGPGSNYPHTDPDGTHETGSHGCVNTPTPAGAWLYHWARVGATVDVYGTAPTGPVATPTPPPTQPPSPTPTQQPPTDTPAPTNTPTNNPTVTPTP